MCTESQKSYACWDGFARLLSFKMVYFYRNKCETLENGESSSLFCFRRRDIQLNNYIFGKYRMFHAVRCASNKFINLNSSRRIFTNHIFPKWSNWERNRFSVNCARKKSQKCYKYQFKDWWNWNFVIKHFTIKMMTRFKWKLPFWFSVVFISAFQQHS